MYITDFGLHIPAYKHTGSSVDAFVVVIIYLFVAFFKTPQISGKIWVVKTKKREKTKGAKRKLYIC